MGDFDTMSDKPAPGAVDPEAIWAAVQEAGGLSSAPVTVYLDRGSVAGSDEPQTFQFSEIGDPNGFEPSGALIVERALARLPASEAPPAALAALNDLLASEPPPSARDERLAAAGGSEYELGYIDRLDEKLFKAPLEIGLPAVSDYSPGWDGGSRKVAGVSKGPVALVCAYTRVCPGQLTSTRNMILPDGRLLDDVLAENEAFKAEAIRLRNLIREARRALPDFGYDLE